MRSTHQPAETSPLIEGGTYRNKYTGETGTINGTVVEPTSGNLYGNLYTFKSGGNPIRVVENTRSFSDWELERVGSKQAAAQAEVAHKKAREAAAAIKEATRKAAAGSRA